MPCKSVGRFSAHLYLLQQDTVLREGELRVWHLARYQVAGAVPEEAGHGHVVLREALLPQPHREHGQTYDHAAGRDAAGMRPVPRALRE